MSGWIVSEIVQTPNERNRIAIVKRFIQIAEECLHLKNYNSLAAIVWSLGHIAIKRLKRTWAVRDIGWLARWLARACDFADNESHATCTGRAKEEPQDAE